MACLTPKQRAVVELESPMQATPRSNERTTRQARHALKKVALRKIRTALVEQGFGEDSFF